MEDGGDGVRQWIDNEVLDLIGFWGDTFVQAKLEVPYRNRSVFESISKQMAERGHRRTWLQCQRKVKSLKAKFKEVKVSNQRSSRGLMTCPFYSEIGRVLGDQPSSQSLQLLDCSRDASKDDPETPWSRTNSADSHDIDDETGDAIPELLPSTSSTGENSSSAPSTETCGKNAVDAKSSGAASAKSRKRKTKLETTLAVFAQKISRALHSDGAELHLRMQAAQHEHELQMFSMFTDLLERSNHSPHPPFYQTSGQPSAHPPFHSSTQSPPLCLASPPPFNNETTIQPLSCLQDRAQPPPFNQVNNTNQLNVSTELFCM